MPRKTAARHGLYVTEKHSGSFYHITAYPVTIGHTQDEMIAIDEDRYYDKHITWQTIRNASDRDIAGLYLHDLQATSQGHDDDRKHGLYGFECHYQDVYSVNLRQAERMAKTLKTIETRLDKLVTKYGHPTTFGAYLARVAEAIHATAFVFPINWHGSSYRDNEHHITDIRDGISRIDSLAYAWQQAGQETKTA